LRIALILTGGSGTRLEPITKTLNKGLVPVDGQPALERIIHQLELSGIDKIIVLAGQLSWQVESFINSRFKNSMSKIMILTTPPVYSPAERLLQASQHWVNSSQVVLIYCDNLFEDDVISRHLNEFSDQRVLVQKREPGNIDILNSGKVSYSVKREEKFKYVELGYWILNPSTFYTFLNEEGNLPKALERLTYFESVNPRKVTDYRTLSDLARYADDRLTKRKTVFLDRDGILIESIGEGEYVRNINEVRFLKENLNFLSELSSIYNIDYIVVTNQAGIERKLVTFEEVDEINRYIALQLLDQGVPILAFYICPHHWDSNCRCRKPKPGLLHRAIKDFKINPAQSLIIGDRESDVGAGINTGIQPFLFIEKMTSEEREVAYKSVIDFLQEQEIDSD
jgi:D-glycero-D-manno-heptose 1,7-bisphosphate phosphatase